MDKNVKVQVTLNLRYQDSLESGYGGETDFVNHAFRSADIDGLDVDTGDDEWVSITVVEGPTILP